MNRIFFTLLTLLAVFMSMPTMAAEARTLVVPGTGDSQGLLRDLTASFHQKQTQLRVEIPDSIGSKGGIRAVIEGRASVARTARALNSAEAAEGLEQYPFAHSPVVFALHPSVEGVSDLSVEQLVGIYQGHYRNWQELGGPDHRIYLVEREPGDSSLSILEKLLAGFGEGRNQGKVFYSTSEAATAVAEHRYTIGYLPLPVARTHDLKILSIDGVAPDENNVRSGTFPYVLPFYLVFRGQPDGDVERFLRFLHGKQAAVLIREAGLVPIGSALPEGRIEK